MSDDKEKSKRSRDVGITSEHVIAYKFQYEFERSLSLIRAESDPSITRNGLFDLITSLAGFILQNLDENDEFSKKIEGEIDLLKSDELSPKTSVEYIQHYEHYKLTYDSYNVECLPQELQVAMEQLNREREEVTIRNLWAMLGRLKSVAYKKGFFKSDYLIDRSQMS